LGLATGCVTALCLATLPGASADGDDEEFPSREQVRQAQERAETTADRVAEIKAQLAAADQRLEELTVAAGKAAEAYNGARYKLQQARTAARRAQRHADAAAARVRRVEDRLSSAIVKTYENGGTLTGLGVLIQDPDPDALLERLDAYRGVAGAMQSTLDRYESAKVVAGVLADRAESALDAQKEATAEAEKAKEAAEAAVAEAEAAVSSIAAEKKSLIRELAEAQHISVRLAEQRQRALARKAAEAAADQAAEEAAQLVQQEEQAEQDQAQAEQEEPEQEQAQAEPEQAEPEQAEPEQQQQAQQGDDPPAYHAPSKGTGNGSGNGSGGDDGSSANNGGNGGNGGDNDPQPPTDSKPAKPHRARTAIAYAKAQLGEPYVYGADGPDSWDCSGLTMQSWAAAGEYLSHWSVAQYYETTPISFSDLRRGDLLFWGETNDPDSIYHVAMYLGHGKMIQAPRPGRSVEIVSIYYWILPNFYTRV
jgi:peptidoglycan DL-endopeptidase CwlO